MNGKKLLLSAMLMFYVSLLMPVAQMDSVNALAPKTEVGHATENEFRRFASEDQVTAWNNAVSPSWLRNLSNEERENIANHTGFEHSIINRMLREGNKNEEDSIVNMMLREGYKMEAWEEKMNSISSGLQKFSLSEGIVTYRTIHTDRFDHLGTSEIVGTKLTDAAFMSTSLFDTGAFNGNVKLELHVPPGRYGAAIMSLSQFPEECEFLLDKGTSYIIREAKREHDHLKLVAEVLPRGN